MNRLSAALAVLLFSITAAAAPLRWHWSNPLPHGNNIAGIASQTDWGYVQVTDHGQFYTSPDLATWTPNDTGTTKALRGVAFFGARMVTVGESGLVLWSDQPETFNLLDLGTTDWLESVAASPTKLVAVGDNAAIYTSTSGTNWTRQAVGFSDWMRGVAYGGGVFVAVGENGRIAVSADGVKWNTRSSGVTAHLSGVAFTGTFFMAVGDAGTVLLSNAGATSWTRQAGTGATGDLGMVAIEAAGSRLVGGENELRLDTSFGFSSTWTDQIAVPKASPAPKATYLAALWDGTNFVAGGRGGLTVTGRRPAAGAEFGWSTFPSPTRSWLFDITTAVGTGTNLSATWADGGVRYATNRTTNTFYVAVGDQATIVTSDHGAAWSTALTPSSSTGAVYLGVAGDARGLVAVGSKGTLSFSPVGYVADLVTNRFTNGAAVATVVFTNQVNALGLAWYAGRSPTAVDLQAVCAGAGTYVVGGDLGFLATSPDGTNWTVRASGTTHYLSGLEAWPGGFVAVGDQGTILTSPDAVAWTRRSLATTNWIYRVRWLGGQLVAAGQNGAIYTSPDAVDWTARNSGTTTWINDIESVDGTYFAVGNQGLLITSPDAVLWSADTSLISGKSIYGAATLDGRLVVVGIEGLILRTQVGAFPEPVRIVDWPKQPTDQFFLFTGSPDQRFRLDRGTDLKTWENGAAREITDPAGTFLLLDDVTNSPLQQFFRTVDLP